MVAQALPLEGCGCECDFFDFFRPLQGTLSRFTSSPALSVGVPVAHSPELQRLGTKRSLVQPRLPVWSPGRTHRSAQPSQPTNRCQGWGVGGPRGHT